MNVLVTGGTKGLGRAVVERFLAQGDTVAVNYHEDDTAYEALVRDFGSDHLFPVKYDVGKGCQVAALFSALRKQWQCLDIVITNAGHSVSKLLARTTDADFERLYATNVLGTVYCVRQAVGWMRVQQRGHIVQIASWLGLAGGSGVALYAMTKAAVIGFMQEKTVSLGRDNIAINTVAPGFMETRMTASLTTQDKERVRAKHALQRFVTPSEAAAFIVDLASKNHVSGQFFNLDSRLCSVE